MFDSIHRHIMAGYAVSIEFTKQGWRQFARLNASLGTRYIRAFILQRDVAEYRLRRASRRGETGPEQAICAAKPRNR